MASNSKNSERSTIKRNQNKYRHNAPLHIKHKFLSVHFSKELRTKYKKRSFPVRKGDLVKVMSGQFKGKTGKINAVLLKRTRVYIDNIQRNKQDGSNPFIPLHPSNLQLLDIDLTDKNRIKALERK